jgi:hypothetical protein
MSKAPAALDLFGKGCAGRRGFSPRAWGVCFLLAVTGGWAEEPVLPSGLGALAAPATATVTAPEPALPGGLDAPTSAPAAAPAEAPVRLLPDAWSGFWEARGGVRLQDDPHEKDASIGETRLQLQVDQAGERTAIRVAADFLFDPVMDAHEIDIEDGDGWLDLRQANLLLRLSSFLDVKLGRQINTWGTGDMLFINDLFPKDWNAFLIGRDDEYLKAPSDAIKIAVFSGWANLDVIYTPRFDSDRYIDGRRISYWNSAGGSTAGRDGVVDADKPDSLFRDDEWAARLYRNIGAVEAAIYGYDGFWKSPGGMDPQTGQAIFPRLQVFGASLRGPFGKGILSLEGGWYRSADDLDGDDPYVRNSETRGLVGYEQELMQNLTGGIQVYVEHMSDYGAYRRELPDGMTAADENRQVVTLRLTKLLMNQNLRVGMMVFCSPTDRDLYLKPNINYKIDDHWIVETGGNIFIGRDAYTFFGQFEDNNNAYVSVRYGF